MTESDGGAIPVARGCGSRKKGGIYAETMGGKGGKPLEEFILDPPIPINPAALGVTPVGVKFVKMENPEGVMVPTILDWVGSTYYPNVADFLEEVRRFGLSRRLPKNLPWSEITPGTQIVMIHAKAILESPGPYWEDMPVREAPCPRTEERHLGTVPEMCAGLWWSDVEEGIPDPRDPSGRSVMRKMPSFSYPASCPPSSAYGGRSPGIFAAFPVGRLVMVDPDPEDGEILDNLNRSGLPVASVDK